jgi:hypothetical protein
MFLKCNRRIKDGKKHRYWSIVPLCPEVGSSSARYLYLGEINDTQREGWIGRGRPSPPSYCVLKAPHITTQGKLTAP